MIASSSSSSKDSADDDDTESDTSRKSFRKKITESSLCPFKLEWSIGLNTGVPLINLTTENRTIIAYACSQAVMLYNYDTKEMTPLQGHKNAVRTMSVSADGKWLLTADFEEDSVVVVWDTETGTPVCTLFNPHGEDEMTACGISPNAKYVVTVGNEKRQKVHFWLWTYGRDEPDASVELTENCSDRVKQVAFNEKFPEEFALTSDHSVLFFLWERKKLRYCRPKILGKVRRLGTFNCSCYLPSTQEAFTATTTGFVLVWSGIVDKETSKIDNEEKKHLKSVPLQKKNITVMLHHEGMIVTGDSAGRINFYDSKLKILYWCKNCALDSLRSIGFDLRSGLLGPVPVVSESELEFGEEEDAESEIEFQDDKTDSENLECDEKMQYLTNIGSMQRMEKIPSILSVNLEPTCKSHWRRQSSDVEHASAIRVPSDATIQRAPFCVGRFFVCTVTGVVALIDIPNFKCHFFSQNVLAPITSLDAHPESHHLVTGNDQGLLSLYNYQTRGLVTSRKTPPLPDFRPILDDQVKTDKIIYVTCPQSHENLTAVTALRYSPLCDMLACGLENGAIWMLHPVTLEPIDPIPYKHSSESVLKMAFTKCANYMAYSDNALAVGVFKKNPNKSAEQTNVWNFVGKYRSHYLSIRDILFGPSTSDSSTPRLFSLGEDGDLVEYDLENSGPYPYPGLRILQIDRVERNATPLCLSWYPRLGVETYLMISNSDYKYKLLNDMTKLTRGTFLGPTFGSPVKHFELLPGKGLKNNCYMVYATDREIGLQLVPFDGNPYKTIGIVGHPQKITNISVNYDGSVLFTSGYNDPCVFAWKIKWKSVDALARLGGPSLYPYYCLIEGGRKGWLLKEMQDLFYYAQILHQGENTTAIRIVSDKVSTKQIPNLMRGIGYYPSNEELEDILSEVAYRDYAETGQLVEEITFEDFVKLYINHRPAFGLSMREMEGAFRSFLPVDRKTSETLENPTLTRKQFLNVLFGKGPEGQPEWSNRLFGEPLTVEEAYMYLKLLTESEDNLDEIYFQANKEGPVDFDFLPERISYKDFTTNIMGIELPEETRTDNE